jgi:acyl-CoA thioesterase FadM
MKYLTEYKVLSGQVDITNHLSNVQYYEFFKSALFSFLQEYKFSTLNQPLDLWPVVFNESCEFFKEVMFNEPVFIEIFFTDLSEKKHKYLCHGIMKNKNGERLAYWKSLHGVMNRTTRKIEPMSEKAFNLLKKFSEELL